MEKGEGEGEDMTMTLFGGIQLNTLGGRSVQYAVEKLIVFIHCSFIPSLQHAGQLFPEFAIQSRRHNF
jgi:hypothetical protein